MNYQDLQQSVIQQLLSLGFQQVNNALSKTTTSNKRVVFNDRVYDLVEQQILTFTILGEGALDETPTIGINLVVSKIDVQNNTFRKDVGDFWLTDVKDLVTFFNFE